MSRTRLIRRILALLVIALSLSLWTVTSDLLELIAEQEEILFGLYSRQRFGQIFILNVLLLGFAYLLLSNMRFGREMAFNVIAVVFSTGMSIFAVILGSQWLLAPRYVEQEIVSPNGVKLEGVTRHRPPNQHYELTFEDKPPVHRSYPNAPRGYDPVDIELTTDRFGYRNKDIQDQYDIVVVGDSFVAGSQVSDHQAWPVRLAEHTDQSVYNLGVSGSDPQVYLNNFVQLGLQFDPQTVIFMLYEGNDFRRTASDKRADDEPSIGDEISRMTKSSPVTAGLRRLSSEVLEAINSDAPVPEYDARMSWMPVRVGGGNDADYYGFKPKRVGYLYGSQSEFAESGEWAFAAEILRKMKQVADENNIDLVIVYAPSKPHVVLPLVRQNIPMDQLRSFVSYRRRSLPSPEEFERILFSGIDRQENVIREFCENEGIGFVSATQELRQQSSKGVQTYFTYDQHWTPKGNELVAKLVSEHLSKTN